MRLLVLIFIFTSQIFAYQYNALLLKTQVALYPKIIVLDKNIEKNIQDHKIDFAVIYEDVDELVAQKLQESIYKKFSTGIENFSLEVKTLNISDCLSDNSCVEKTDAIYVLKIAPQRLKRVAQMIRGKNIYSFTYDKKDLEEGFLINVSIEKRVQIYINKKVLLENSFQFANTFYNIARIIE
ncbi:hypothetical protein NitYY0826_C0900 [Nitratiruptor sp. YY08-26]|uniref:hypothetical protein n=1 Tax=unclassified Nitratiruptor TaxID=2624044 RepID=UPI0019169470|nr:MULTISPECIES: hypothetical protein [unclassified Nitratiruptor]BCD62032.1 hypothetical protein NitYY0813_C0898 [Nitratiruptor sp. YY08-13]BCD65968.1 hypothetical protein NitYY0826_C0900 [Nitratiruptor sp. YY08-26]